MDLFSVAGDVGELYTLSQKPKGRSSVLSRWCASIIPPRSGGAGSRFRMVWLDVSRSGHVVCGCCRPEWGVDVCGDGLVGKRFTGRGGEMQLLAERIQV